MVCLPVAPTRSTSLGSGSIHVGDGNPSWTVLRAAYGSRGDLVEVDRGHEGREVRFSGEVKGRELLAGAV